MGSWWDGPKVTPEEAAAATLDALEAGEDEFFPGELSRNAALGFEADPKGLQARFLAGPQHG
jgi:hypothetical protein